VLCLCLSCNLLLSISISAHSLLVILWSAPLSRHQRWLVPSAVVIKMHHLCFSASVTSYIEVVVMLCAFIVTAFRVNWFRRRMRPYKMCHIGNKGSFNAGHASSLDLFPLETSTPPLPHPYCRVETYIPATSFCIIHLENCDFVVHWNRTVRSHGAAKPRVNLPRRMVSFMNCITSFVESKYAPVCVEMTVTSVPQGRNSCLWAFPIFPA
jgi:hypothetical protein